MRIFAFYKKLLACYGYQHWWPCKSPDPFEIVVGAVLTQNTAWTNVERALKRLEAACLMTPAAILSAPEPTLQEAIRPAGFFHQKSAYLRAVSEFYQAHAAGYARFCGKEELAARRKALLAVKGVGRETADDILLYAFRQPVFIIDAYTRRIAERHLGLDGQMPYEALQKTFTDALPRDVKLYGEYHALMVQHGKNSCLKSGCAGFPPPVSPIDNSSCL